MIEKDYLQIRVKSAKLKIAIVILMLLGIAFLVRLTPLIDKYWINFLTAFIISNAINLIVIAGLLIALHIVELKKFKQILEKEDEKNVH